MCAAHPDMETATTDEMITSIDSTQDHEVLSAINKIKEDPSKIGSIMDSISNKPEVLGAVLQYMKKNPELGNAANSAIGGDSKLRSQANRVSKKERKDMQEKIKKAKKSTPVEKKIQAIKITQSRVLKTVQLPLNFPKGTIYESCDPFETEIEGIYIYYSSESAAKNKRASKIADMALNGDIIFISSVDGVMADLEESRFMELEK